MPPRITFFPLVLALFVAACANESGSVNDGSINDESANSLETGGTGDQWTDAHGTVSIEVVSANGDSSLFDGTVTVRAVLHYGECLQDFYAKNPAFEIDGSAGAPIFAEWADRLCAEVENTAACSVIGIDQYLLEANDAYTIVVEFKITDPATISGNQFRVGPLPTKTLAGCDPQVELRMTGLIGRDAEDLSTWSIGVLPADATAATDQANPLRVEAEPVF